MSEFTCTDCGSTFSVKDEVLSRYPGWKPRQCLNCRDQRSSKKPTKAKKPAKSITASRTLTTDEVLERFHDGPMTGVFTDGGCSPNPGDGGWGAAYVVDGELVAEASGGAPDTTNNRMELEALIAGIDLAPEGEPLTVYSDSNYVVNTVNTWAKGWEERGWKRKSGPVENLDLIKKAYYAARKRPELTFQWIRAHSGYRWNEYVDALSNDARLRG